MRRERDINKERVYDILGIPPEQRGKEYTIHHEVFKSDVKANPQMWRHIDLDGIENLFPLPREEHERLHKLVEEIRRRQAGRDRRR